VLWSDPNLSRDRWFADSPLEEAGFELLVPLQSQHNRGTGPMSPTASIRIALLIPLANSISISVASGTRGSNPLSSSRESGANLTFVRSARQVISSSPTPLYSLVSAAPSRPPEYHFQVTPLAESRLGDGRLCLGRNAVHRRPQRRRLAAGQKAGNVVVDEIIGAFLGPAGLSNRLAEGR
jgi:hypothetical protein